MDIDISKLNITQNNQSIMKKILFCATYPNQPIGYSKIANVLTNYLADLDNIQVYYFGFSNFPSTTLKDRYIDKRIKFIDVYQQEKMIEENFGTTIICDVMDKVKPDILFIYNDLIVTCRIFNALQEYKMKKSDDHTYKVVVYIDLVYAYEKTQYIEYLNKESDYIFVFSNIWKKHLVEKHNFDNEKIFILKHFIDPTTTQMLSQKECKNELGLKETDFLIINTNRNTYRKMIDITIHAFIIFLNCLKEEKRDSIKLLFTCNPNTKSGYDLLELIRVYCKKCNVDFDSIKNNNILIVNGSTISDDMMNKIYNASDLGLNTCCGEGFGLCNLEGGYLGIPQVVSNVGGLKDIFGTFPDMIVEPSVVIQTPTMLDDHLGELQIVKAEDVAKKMLAFYMNESGRLFQGEQLHTHIKFNYNKKLILKGFKKDIKEILKTI